MSEKAKEGVASMSATTKSTPPETSTKGPTQASNNVAGTTSTQSPNREIKPARGSTTRRQVKGRGVGSTRGRKSGRGTKGYKARSGSKSLVGFEGGQNPLIRRMPKVGFSNEPHRNKVGTITTDQLIPALQAGETYTLALLKKMGLVKGRMDSIKVVKGKKTFSEIATAKFAPHIYFSKSAATLLGQPYIARKKDYTGKTGKKAMRFLTSIKKKSTGDDLADSSSSVAESSKASKSKPKGTTE